MFEKLPVPQVNYQGAYEDIGNKVGGFISSIPDLQKKETDYQFEDEKKRKQWATIEEQMKDEKQFKITMGNVLDNTMGDNYSDEEKNAVKSELKTQDARTVAAHTAEFISTRSYLDQMRQKYPDAVFPKPIYGQSLKHYQDMTALVLQGAESKAIAGAMGNQKPVPTIQAPQEQPQPTDAGANPNSFYTDEQAKNEMANYGEQQPVPTIPQPTQAQGAQTKRELAAGMAGQGIDIGGSQAKTALSTLPDEEKAARDKDLQAHKDDLLAETKRWHDIQKTLGEKRAAISKGQKDDLKMLSIAKLIQDGQEAVGGLDAKVYTVDKGISALEKEKRRIQQQITDAYGDEVVTATYDEQLKALDTEIDTYKNQKEEYKALQDEMKTDLDFWKKDVLSKTSQKKGFQYPPKEKPKQTTPTSGTGVTKTGKKYSIQTIK